MCVNSYQFQRGLLREEGWEVNHKRVERLWRREGLKVPKKQPKRGRLWLNDGSCIRLRPQYKNHVWSYDFVATRTANGRGSQASEHHRRIHKGMFIDTAEAASLNRYPPPRLIQEMLDSSFGICRSRCFTVEGREGKIHSASTGITPQHGISIMAEQKRIAIEEIQNKLGHFNKQTQKAYVIE